MGARSYYSAIDTLLKILSTIGIDLSFRKAPRK
jgi:hypothetical protein